ncbi:hypothetical protein FHS59_004049 [Algoriphagus iocasae]|jgi:hypothetical protein|uniref:Uncharacterized protein n=1 Tax=Algoriphagus iocasae TaxID=1836499 RepID=A0A841MWI0_9BACT|nr:hypothetical protein [Algoriphagus iocasae]
MLLNKANIEQIGQNSVEIQINTVRILSNLFRILVFN